MCNSKAKSLVTYHYRHGTSGSATVALSSLLLAFPPFSSSTLFNFFSCLSSTFLLRHCAIPITPIRGFVTPRILSALRSIDRRGVSSSKDLPFE